MTTSPAPLQFNIDGMSCVACATRLEKVLNRVPGVAASVNFATETAQIQPSAALKDAAQRAALEQRVVAAIEQAGFHGQALSDLDASPLPQLSAADQHQGAAARLTLLTLVLAAPFLLEMAGMLVGRHGLIPPWWQAALATAIQVLGGWTFYRGAWLAARAGSGNMDTLVALGTSAAFGLSWYQLLAPMPEMHHEHHAAAPMLAFEASAMVIGLVRLGKWLEQRARARTHDALSALMRLAPTEALRLRDDGQTETVPVAQLVIGDRIWVRPGDSVAVDGEVISGRSSLDESSLTGESLPVAKEQGDTIYAGTRNLNGSLVVRASSLGRKTRHARIVLAVAAAQGSKAPVQDLADRVSGLFVPVVIAIALMAGGYAWFQGLGGQTAILRAVAVLVVACPCALGLATPVAVMVAVGAAAQRGLLFSHAQALQRLAEISRVVFDKTGTLTQGQAQLVRLVAAGTHSERELLTLAASVEQGSEHPLAAAIVRAAQQQGVTPWPAQQTQTEAGRGIVARLTLTADGGLSGSPETEIDVWIGAPEWLNLPAPETTQVSAADRACAWLAVGFAPGRATSLAPTALQIAEAPRDPAVPGQEASLKVPASLQAIGWLAIRDDLRPEAEAAITGLRARGLDVALLSGDGPLAVAHVAQTLQIDPALARMSPEDKAKTLRHWQHAGGSTTDSSDKRAMSLAMVGDGINDAVALAAADVGIAIGSGSDVAMQTADITLMHNDLRGVPQAVDIARRTLRVIRQNLAFAFAFNVIGLPLAALGVLPPALSGAAMAMSSIIVVTNALRLRRMPDVEPSVRG